MTRALAGILCAIVLAGCSAGFYIPKVGLDPVDRQYTSNNGRSFVVAGCVPQDRPPIKGVIGSVFTICNDLTFKEGKVVESTFVSCSDMFKEGVLASFILSEVNNRSWEFFRFSCRDMATDGTLGSSVLESPNLFAFSRRGTDFSTQIPLAELPVGIMEVNNQLEVRESLLQFGMLSLRADTVIQAGRDGAWPANMSVSPRIPSASPVLVQTTPWLCPPGMVVTGAAIGHIPQGKGEWTRPVYVLAECRKLVKIP